MKANKALKRLAKIEESVSEVMERYSATAPHIREALQDAKAGVARAKEAVSLQASSVKAAVKKAAKAQAKTPKKSKSMKKAAKKAAAKKKVSAPVQTAMDA